jgi:hypothetical protein
MGAELEQDDADVHRGRLFLGSTGNDNFQIRRSPPGGAPANLLTFDATGQLTVASIVSTANAGITTAGGAVLTGSGTVKFGLSADSAGVGYLLTNNVYGPQDTTKPSWCLIMNGNADYAVIARRAANAGSGVMTNLLTLDAAGNMTITGATGTKSAGTTWANPSDIRLKQDIGSYARGLTDIHVSAQSRIVWLRQTGMLRLMPAVREIFPSASRRSNEPVPAMRRMDDVGVRHAPNPDCTRQRGRTSREKLMNVSQIQQELVWRSGIGRI